MVTLPLIPIATNAAVISSTVATLVSTPTEPILLADSLTGLSACHAARCTLCFSLPYWTILLYRASRTVACCRIRVASLGLVDMPQDLAQWVTGMVEKGKEGQHYAISVYEWSEVLSI